MTINKYYNNKIFNQNIFNKINNKYNLLFKICKIQQKIYINYLNLNYKEFVEIIISVDILN